MSRLAKTIDKHLDVTIVAQGDVTINEKIDQNATARVTPQNDILIGQKLDQNTNSTITSINGSITVIQGMSGGATAILPAVNEAITMDTIDGGCTQNWSAQNLNCPHQNGTVNHI